MYAGAPIFLLDIEHCVFLDTKIAHHIKSRARNTVVRDSRIEDGESGTSSYLIDVPNGGNVLIQGNQMEKGAQMTPGAGDFDRHRGVAGPAPDTLKPPVTVVDAASFRS